VDLFSIQGAEDGPTFLFDDQAPFPAVITAVEESYPGLTDFFRDSRHPSLRHSPPQQKRSGGRLKEVLHREGLLLRYAVRRCR